jgi:hypothetical protein
LTQSKQECMSYLTTDSICQECNIKCHYFICLKEKYDTFAAKYRSNKFYELKWDFKNQQELLYKINKPSELAAEAYFTLAELIAASSGQYI